MSDEREFQSWLEEIGVVRADGTFDPEQARKELWDFYHLIDRVERIYDYVTGGRCSDARVLEEVVRGLVDEHMEEEIQAGLR